MGFHLVAEGCQQARMVFMRFHSFFNRNPYIKGPKRQFFLHFLTIFCAAREAALAADLITAWKLSGQAALAADLITASRPDGGPDCH